MPLLPLFSICVNRSSSSASSSTVPEDAVPPKRQRTSVQQLNLGLDYLAHPNREPDGKRRHSATLDGGKRGSSSSSSSSSSSRSTEGEGGKKARGIASELLDIASELPGIASELAVTLESAAGMIVDQTVKIGELEIEVTVLRAKLAEIKKQLQSMHDVMSEGAEMSEKEASVYRLMQGMMLGILDALEDEPGVNTAAVTVAGTGMDVRADENTATPTAAAPGKLHPMAAKRAAAAAEAKKGVSVVNGLKQQGKMKAAKAAYLQIAGGKVISEGAMNKAAKALEEELWKLGGLGTVEAVLKKAQRPSSATDGPRLGHPHDFGTFVCCC